MCAEGADDQISASHMYKTIKTTIVTPPLNLSFEIITKKKLSNFRRLINDEL